VAPVASRPVTLVAGAQLVASVTGTTNAYWLPATGSSPPAALPLDDEERAGAAVCVIGETIRRELFGGLARSARDARQAFSCEVIGLLASKGQARWAGPGRHRGGAAAHPAAPPHRQPDVAT
jgi:putative ABC transport system permease protein